jgi:hypothetical protein
MRPCEFAKFASAYCPKSSNAARVFPSVRVNVPSAPADFLESDRGSFPKASDADNVALDESGNAPVEMAYIDEDRFAHTGSEFRLEARGNRSVELQRNPLYDSAAGADDCLRKIEHTARG